MNEVKRLCFLWSFLFFCLVKDVHAVQTFQEQPRYTEVNPGQSALLVCKVYNMKGECSWQKDGKPQGMFTGKYEWAGDRSSGDCSVRIFDVAEVDDGDWECQVTASAFTAQDALTSNIAHLVRRVAPDFPYIEVDNSPTGSGRNFTVVEGVPASIKCIARYGNPAATFKWFIGSEELLPHNYNQTNSTEVDSPKLWRSVSTLHTQYKKKDHGRQVRCVAMHEAYDSKTYDVGVSINVQYKPTVSVQGVPTTDLEEGIDSVSLRCVADSNPPANMIWRKVGDDNIFSFQDSITFTPASRKHSATYTCEARNPVGMSEPTAVEINVKYAPFGIVAGPAPFITAGLHNKTILECNASGNPKPSYIWMQKVEGSSDMKIVGHNASLIIQPVTYSHQGTYVCLAENFIKGNERRLQSEPVRLEVVGKPEVLKYYERPEATVERGQDALLQVFFCSDPQPRWANWEWGSVQLETGNGNGRYVAETYYKLDQETNGRDDCYSARLLVQHADAEDSRSYVFNVGNEKGNDTYAVFLAVREPMSMTLVIGVVVACLTLMVLVTLIVLYTFKTEKWCFSREREFKPTDLESRGNMENSSKVHQTDISNGNGNATIITGTEKQVKGHQF